MNLSHHPNRALRKRPALGDCHQQALGQRPEVESAIESVGEGTKILCGIFSEPKAVVAATQACLEVSQHCVDPLQLWHILGLAPSHDRAFMGTTSLGHGAEAGQTVGINGAASGQAFTGPLRDGL